MNFGLIFLIFNIGLIASVFNVINVIIGYARALPGQVYMATGHYYLDYFQYLQALSQGWHGHWILTNYYEAKTFLGMWQFLILGQIGRHLGLSQIATYWLSVIILSLTLSVLIFLLIKKLLINKPFYWQLSAYILALFAAPFFRIINTNNHFVTTSYRFWNDKAVLLDRFGGVPYHIVDQIIILSVIILVADSLEKIKTLSKKSFIIRIITIVGAMTFLLSFSPVYSLLVIVTLFLTSILLFIWKRSWSRIIFLWIILAVLFPITLYIRDSFNQHYSVVTKMELAWQVHPPFIDVLLTTGPILLFAWLGVKEYFHKLSFIKIVFFNFILISYLFFFSSLATFLGITNTRFLTPFGYIFFAVLTVAGIKKIKHLFIISLFVFLLFIPANLESVRNQLNDQNLNSSPISYLPKGMIDGLKFLATVPGQRAVLTTPAQFLGSIVSTYSGKTAYIVRPGQQPDYDQKSDLSAKFYWNIFSEDQAKEFMNKNQIGFVVLTSIEGYPPDNLKKYKFLKEIYHNQDIVIYQKI